MSDVYDKLFVLFRASCRFVRLGDDLQIIDKSDTRTPEERVKEAHGRVDEANVVFRTASSENGCMSQKICTSLSKSHKELIGTVSDFTHALAGARETGRHIDSEQWQATMDRLNNDYSQVFG